MRFSCLGKSCNRCCTGGQHGAYLALSDADLLRLDSDVARVTLARPGGQLSMVLPAGGTCPLWAEREGCTVYDRRPAQCRNYPAWGPLFRDPKRLEFEKKRCPGIGQGPRVKRRDRLVALRTDRTATFARLEQ